MSRRTDLKGLATLALLPIAAAACSDASAGGVEAAVRDSAGITIVENVPAPEVAPALLLSAEPATRIGALEGSAEYLLDGVQHATRLSDGTIVVVNGGSQELRYYDAAGRHVRTVGRSGAGPGEYLAISYMRRLRGDSLLIFDSRNRRLTTLDASGAHVRDEPAMRGTDALRVQGALEDGTLLVMVPKTTMMVPESSDLARDTAYFEVQTADTAVRVPFEYPGGERSIRVDAESGSIRSIALRILPFARNRMVAAGRDVFVVGSTDSYELHVIDGTGSVRAIVRRPDVRPEPVTEALVTAAAEEGLRQQRAAGREVTADAAAASLRNTLELQRVPTTPAYGRVVAMQDGGFLVEDFTMPGAEPASGRWALYGADGRMRGVVEIPSGLRVLYADDEVLIGVARDEYDVEYVHVHTLTSAED